MNLINSVKNNSWAFAGFILGNIYGVATNFIRNGSLFKNDFVSCKAPFKRVQPLVMINNYRELNKTIFSPTEPRLFHLIFPLVHLIPVIGFNAYNAICHNQKNQRSMSLKNRLYVMVRSTVCPGAHFALLLLGFGCMKAIFHKQTTRLNIDASGHILIQFNSGVHALHCAKNMSETATPSQIKMYSVAFLVCSITDAIWAYNTAANCHSIADVVTAVAYVTFTQIGIQAAQQLWNRGSCYLNKLIFK